MENKMRLIFYVVLILIVSCDSLVVKKVTEDQGEIKLDIEDESSLLLQKKFNDMLNIVYKELFENPVFGVDLIVIPVANKDSIQSIALVKGIYKPIPEYEFSGYVDLNKSRVIFLNLNECIYGIIDKSVLNDSAYIFSMDELGLGSYNPTYRYVTIYSSDSITLSEFPIIVD